MNSATSLLLLDDEDRLPILADDDTWTRYMNRYPAGDVCKADCDLMYREHYHCITGEFPRFAVDSGVCGCPPTPGGLQVESQCS